MSSREEILADFQACTGIDDVSIAICQLEEAGWVLVDAVNKALPSNPNGTSSTSTGVPAGPAPDPPSRTSSTNSTPPSLSNAATPMEEVPVTPPFAGASPFPGGSPFAGGSAFVGGAAGVSVADDFYSMAGPSSSFGPRFRMLDFYVQYKDNTHHLKVPDNEDVKTLKQLIQTETGVAPCRQTLKGFKGSGTGHPNFVPFDRRRLSDLHLPKENFIQLITPEKEANGDEEDEMEEENDEEADKDFKLIVTNEEDNQSYTLNFRPHQTVLGVKLDVSTLTTIPVSKQIWTGWPDGVNDDLTLVQLGISKEHRISVKMAVQQRSMPTLDVASTSGAGANTTDTDDDDFEDAHSEVVVMDDDDFFRGADGGTDHISSRRLQPLIPDDYGDDALAGIKFAEEFSNRYGSPHPGFFPGSLSDAIRESCQQSPKERKMLAIYIHHDNSVLTNVFCTQALCADSVVSFLNENFVTFGWDVTYQSNRMRMVKMITDHFGSVAAATIRNLDVERFPLLSLVYKLRGTIEIFQIIHGNVTLDELMSQLLSAQETYQSQIAVEIKEEEERDARNAVKREQDLAFEMAQLADREKQEQKEREEAERRVQGREEAEKRESEAKAAEKAAQQKEKVRLQLKKKLPREPAETEKHAKIRFRVVRGEENLERRFRPDDTLQTVFDYLTVQGYDTPDEHKVLSSWPRKDVTTLDPKQTLEQCKLYPQETLTLEEK